MFYSDDKLVALFIANQKGDVIQSHGGLSYGGLILEREAQLDDVLKYFYHLVKYYSRDFKQIIYKSLPSYYPSVPAQEELYAMFLLGADLIRRDTSSVYQMADPLPYKSRKVRSLKKSGPLKINRSDDPSSFWNNVLTPNLQTRFGVNPVHTLDEIKLLMSRFPDNIKLYEVHGEKLLGATLIFETEDVAHTQYISASNEGRDAGALDFLFDKLIQDVYAQKKYFSMGIFNEEEGRKINGGLMEWKMGFGASIYTLDFYSIETHKFTALSEYE
jgi:hypothetical protein